MAGRIRRDFTVGSIPKMLLQFMLPFMASNAMQVLYSTIDMAVVGKFVGTAGLSGVSQASQIVNFMAMVCFGFANAGQVLVAQALGAGKKKEMNDIIGTFKINQRNAAKYKDNMRFELDLRNIIGSSSISKEGVEWRKADIERHQSRLVAKYPAVGQVIQSFTAAGVDMDKLRQFVNSNSVVMYFFDYLAYDSEQVKKARIMLHIKLEQEATNPTTTNGGQLAYKPVNAKAFDDLLKISKSWTHTADTATYGPKFEQWFNEHLGDAYFL